MIFNFDPCKFHRDCQTLLHCYMEVIEEESEETRAYVQQFGDAALADYYEYYGCPSGTRTKYLLIDFSSVNTRRKACSGNMSLSYTPQRFEVYFL